jgi:hypothetical protein
VRVVLALVEAVLLLLLLDLGVRAGDLVLGLVHRAVADVGSSRHVVCVFLVGGRSSRWVLKYCLK